VFSVQFYLCLNRLKESLKQATDLSENLTTEIDSLKLEKDSEYQNLIIVEKEKVAQKVGAIKEEHSSELTEANKTINILKNEITILKSANESFSSQITSLQSEKDTLTTSSSQLAFLQSELST
jgi:FtsZ-binding cell division protein ZapB